MARAPWNVAMLAALDDADGWMTVDEVLAVGMRAVPPGRAMQHRDRYRRQQIRRHAQTLAGAGTGSAKTTTDDQAIRYGARDVARRGLHGLVRRGRVERNGDQVRRRP